MARISTYLIDSNVTKNDKWIGTDSSGNITKNFTPETLANFYNESGFIGVAGQIAFKYYGTYTGSRPAGSITMPGYEPTFSSVSSVKVSEKSGGMQIIVDYLNELEGTEILLVNTKDPNIYAKYIVNSITQDLVETSFYNLDLQYVSGNGGFTNEDIYAVAFNSYIDQTDKTYVHTQNVASGTWTVTHGLNKFGSVTVVDSGNNVVQGEITYDDADTLTIKFNAIFSGKAYIN